jgi:hypothetical protein
MLTGRINSDNEAVLQIAVLGTGGRMVQVDATIDTGCNGRRQRGCPGMASTQPDPLPAARRGLREAADLVGGAAERDGDAAYLARRHR